MVDRDALCPKNVMSYKLNQLQHRPDKCSKWTNLGPISVDLLFYAPNVANLNFLRIVPAIAL